METMFVKTDLAGVRSAINNCIRDGVKLQRDYSVLDNQLEMKEYGQFETPTRFIWGVNNSAIEAIYLSPQLTQLKLLPVKKIYHDGVARSNWETLRAYFREARLTDSFVPLANPNDIDDARIEQRLRNGVCPKLPDEQEYKEQWREFYKAILVVNSGLPNQRIMTDEERARAVEEDWETHKQDVTEWQAQWNEIHSFDGMTTEQATARYLMQDSQTKATSATPGATWRGNGTPPKTKAEKIAAIEAWDAIPKDQRTKLEDWLIENFGTDLASGELLVPEATFHGWRNLKKS